MSDAAIRREVFGSDPGGHLKQLFHPRGFRVLARIVAIVSWTAVGFVILVTGMWILTAWPARRRSWRRAMVRRWARGLCWIVGMKIEVEGPPPRGPFFLVANHLSYADIVVLLALLEGVFIAKQEIDRWPVIGYLNRLVGTIFLDRNSRRDAMRVVEAIDGRIAAGDGIMVFPEGTSSDGSDVYPMKPAMFEWAARNRFPVHCVTLGYATRPGSPPARTAVCWWGDMTFVPHVLGLCRLPGFRASVRFAPSSLTGDDRADLAVRARDLIASRFVSHDQ